MNAQAKNAPGPLHLIYLYAPEDKILHDKLDRSLSSLKRTGMITTWSEQQIPAGSSHEEETREAIRTADIILLLVSPDFLASDYLSDVMTRYALERLEKGKARVVPIILRPANWQDAPFARLQALPRNGKPVTSWSDPDAVFADIVLSIRRVIEDIQRSAVIKAVPESTLTETMRGPIDAAQEPETYGGIKRASRGGGSASVTRGALTIYELSDVFVKSGFPEVTFVVPGDFRFLKQALQQKGRGVIVEGPSGVGKTTAVEKAVAELRRTRSRAHLPVQRILSARKPEDRQDLKTLREWHNGTVIIDDFHRLDLDLREELVDYLKELADSSAKTKKLAIVGIPRTGQTLVDASFDVATRIDVFTLGQVNDDLVQEMIEKGEEALNILFDRKAEIVLAANGSLNLAQFLCFNLCVLAGIEETQSRTRIVTSDIDSAIERVMRDLAKKFAGSIRGFISMGGPRDTTGLRLLEELAAAKDGFLSLPLLKDRRPDLASGIDGFINNHWMDKFYAKYPEGANHLFFETVGNALVIDDPQLAFYLKKVRFSTLAREVGKIVNLAERKVFISYSHNDTPWLNRLRVHLRPIERDGIIDLWDDTKIKAGMQWKEAIKNALETSRVAVLLISGDFLASDFIAEHELPELLTRVEAGGTTIIPINLAPSVVESTALGAFQAVNPPNDTILGMDYARQEQIFVQVAQTIIQRIKEG